MNGHIANPIYILSFKLGHARAAGIVTSHGDTDYLLHLICFIVYADNLLLTSNTRAYGIREGEERTHTDTPFPPTILLERSIVHLDFDGVGIRVADGDDQGSLSHWKKTGYMVSCWNGTYKAHCSSTLLSAFA